jgi:hypothetical protein
MKQSICTQKISNRKYFLFGARLISPSRSNGYMEVGGGEKEFPLDCAENCGDSCHGWIGLPIALSEAPGI